MKRFFSLVICIFLVFGSVIGFSGCSSKKDSQVLKVYNWEDYISVSEDGSDEYVDLIAEFEKEYGVTVEYSTFGTNENMYNELKINSTGYDLVCPSDYMIMRMIKEDMCEPFSEDFKNGEYMNNVSPYLKHLFELNGWTDYAAAYMWGTMGYVYNPNYVNSEHVKSWSAIWMDEYANQSTIKDSVRDSFFLGLAYTYQDELNALKNKLNSNQLTPEEYNAQLTEIMNRTDEDTLEKVKKNLISVKENLYGFEVDSGKWDAVTGKININFAWSGDAVAAMDEAEEAEVYLNYAIPEECSNIWFDGWVMPKGANVELAEKFINFLSRPENAVSNMNYIGYTSAIAGNDFDNTVFEWVEECYGYDKTEEGVIEYDLSYFFGENKVIYVYEEDLQRQLIAQYPTEDVINRCAVMQYFDDETNAAVNEMWEEFKGVPIPVWAYIVIAAIIAIIIFIAISYLYKGKTFVHKPKKGYKILTKK